LIPISLFDENAGDDAIHTRARGNSYLASLGICDRTLGDDVASNVVRVSIILNDAFYRGGGGLASLWVTDIDCVCLHDSNGGRTSVLSVALANVLIANKGELLLAGNLLAALASVAVWSLQASAGRLAS